MSLPMNNSFIDLKLIAYPTLVAWTSQGHSQNLPILSYPNIISDLVIISFPPILTALLQTKWNQTIHWFLSHSSGTHNPNYTFPSKINPSVWSKPHKRDTPELRSISLYYPTFLLNFKLPNLNRLLITEDNFSRFITIPTNRLLVARVAIILFCEQQLT